MHISRISKKDTYVQFWMLRAVLYWGIVGGVGLALVSSLFVFGVNIVTRRFLLKGGALD